MSREFKNSGIEWVKQIPSNWVIIKGRHLLFLPNRPVRPTDDVVTCFRDGEVILRSERRTEGFTMSDKEIGYQGINKGDIVIHGMDGFAGAMGVSKSTGKGSPVLIVCNPKENDSPQYIIYYLRSLAMTNVFLALATGIRERSCDLRWKKIAELPFLRPSFIEQQKIANYLDKVCGEVDEMIALQEQMIEELKAYKQSVITEAVTKGLNPNVPMKESGIDWIGDVPEHWEVRRIGNLFKLRDEKNYKPMDEVQLLSLYTGIGVFPHGEQEERGNKAITVEGYKVVHKDDIVVNIILAWMGAIGVSNYDGVTSPAYDVYIPDLSKVVPHFFHYVFRTQGIAGECYKYGRGIMMMRWRTYSSEFKQIRVPFPSMEEQQSIASYLDTKCAEIDALIAIKQAKIDELKDYKKSVIYEYVTGKKEVA